MPVISQPAQTKTLTAGGHGQLSAIVKLDRAASWFSELGSLGTAQVPALATSSHRFSTHEFYLGLLTVMHCI